MKKRVLILTLQICLLTCAANAQVAWDYPVKPGSEEWYQLKTEKERISAVQVPEDILAKLTSEELVDLCIKFPLFGYYTAFNTPQDGFLIMVARYNIFGHLLSRKDAGKSLITAYRDAGMSGFRTLPYSNEFWTIKLDYLELILAQRVIMQSLTSEEKVELLSEARKKFSEKIVDEGFSSLPGTQSSVRIMAGILDIEEYQELLFSSNRQIITQFIQTGMLGDVSLFDKIVKMADNYINSKKQIQ